MLARFVSADTIVPGLSDKAGAGNPQELNRYSYVTNNPTKNIDPTGHSSACGNASPDSPCVVSTGEFPRGPGGGGGGRVRPEVEPDSAPVDSWENEGGAIEPDTEPSSSTRPHIDTQVEEQTVEARQSGGESDEAETPPSVSIDDYINNSTHLKTSKTAQYLRTGGFDQANTDFDNLAGPNTIKTYPGGIRSVELPDGTTISVRPNSSGDYPTIQINAPGKMPVKVRYDP